MKYTPSLFTNDKHFQTDAIFSRELTENEKWFQGSEDRLEYFFKKEFNTFMVGANNPFSILENQTKFWKTVGGDTPRVHSGLPKIATQAVVTLVAGSGFELVCSEDEKSRLELIFDDNGFMEIWQEAIATKSWAGWVFYKISHDAEVSEYPIVEMVNPKYADVIVERGRIIQFIFKKYETQKDETIEIDETYSFNDKGFVEIKYQAFKHVKNKEPEKIDVPAGYKDETTGLKFIPALLVNNTAYNSRFPESPYGESDYTASQSLFQMLDDLLSQAELEVSNAKAVKYVNEKLLKKDINKGDTNYDKNETVVEMTSNDMEATEFDIKRYVSLLQPDIRVQAYQTMITDTYARALANMELSPITLGLAGFDAINSSDKSQREREKASLRKREKQIDIEKIALKKLFGMMLMYEDYMNNKQVGTYEIDLEFSDYAVPTLDDRIDTIVKAVQGGVMTYLRAVEELYPDMEEVDQVAMATQLKLENGIPLMPDEVDEQDVEEQDDAEQEQDDAEQEVEDEVDA